MDVSALEAGMITLPLIFFVQDAAPDEVKVCPSLAFSLRHSATGTHLVFDLGIRRDVSAYAPVVREFIEKWMPVEDPQSVEESLAKGGIEPTDVRTVILSHLHWDHLGDPSTFPNATFIVGPGSRELLASAFPENPAADVLSSSIPLDRSRFLTADKFTTSIGPFPRALDYFGDGSLYLVDAAGHLAGHINVIARTSPTGSWIFLGGDTAHDVRLLTGEKEVAFGVDPSGKTVCAHAHKDEAVAHIRRVGSLVGLPRVHVLLAHDLEWYEANKGGPAFLPGVIPPR